MKNDYRSGCSNRATLFYSNKIVKSKPIKIENNYPSKEYQEEMRNKNINDEIPSEFENFRFGEFIIKVK